MMKMMMKTVIVYWRLCLSYRLNFNKKSDKPIDVFMTQREVMRTAVRRQGQVLMKVVIQGLKRPVKPVDPVRKVVTQDSTRSLSRRCQSTTL